MIIPSQADFASPLDPAVEQIPGYRYLYRTGPCQALSPGRCCPNLGNNILDRPRRELVVFDSWNWDTLCEKRLSTSKTSRTAADSWLSFAGLMALCVARDAIPVTWSISKRPVSGSATASTIARSSA